ncbi:MAG: UDP-N-acetylmuramate dehydrogenase [Geminicoccaceae bacterium]|nr:UDP-N-acetylmuramate dehydrogenase [Geminicoccaceae bacterium]
MSERNAFHVLGDRVRDNVPLKPITWFRVGGPARRLMQARSEQDVRDALVAAGESLILPMGVASNMLVRDGGIDGLVLRFGGELSKVEADGGTVIAGAGALDQRVAQVAQRAGLSGLEFFIGIPGTIGGAVRMNAGAFGGETADRFRFADCMDTSGRVHRLTAADLGFGYRHSELPAGFIVLRAAFDCEPGDGEAIARRMAGIRAEREAAQPLRAATGGSTFRNPPGAKAWKLIDDAGCRGLRIGQAMVSEVHCNFLINTGDATAAEIEALGEEVRRRVSGGRASSAAWPACSTSPCCCLACWPYC